MKVNTQNISKAVSLLLADDDGFLSASTEDVSSLTDAVAADADVTAVVLAAVGTPVSALAFRRGVRKLSKFAKRHGKKARRMVKKAVSSLKKRAKKTLNKAKKKSGIFHPKKKAAKKPMAKKKAPAKKRKTSASVEDYDFAEVARALLAAADALEG